MTDHIKQLSEHNIICLPGKGEKNCRLNSFLCMFRRSDDSAERIDRQSRTSNIGFHGFFHHRSFDNNPDSNRQNIALLPPSSVATPKDASMQQQPTPEPLYATDPLLQTSLYHQVPNDKLFMTPQIVDVSLQKYSGKDFVALSAVDDGWLAPGNMKQEAAIEFYPPQPDLDSSTEVQKLVSIVFARLSCYEVGLR